MKVLKAKANKKKNKTHNFEISRLKIVASREVNEDVIQTGVMLHPIEVRDRRSEKTNEPKYGANGSTYVYKDFDVWRGNRLVKAAIQMGCTHIEGVFVDG